MIYTVTLNPALDRELSVPELAFDTVLRASAGRADLGGKGFNVSRMLAALGAESVALGFAGGRTGEALCDGLAAQGIATDFVWIAGETRTNVCIVDGTRHLKVNEPGPAISGDELGELRALVRRRARPGDWWVLAGSLPPGVPDSVYADLIGDIHAAGARAALDTSGAALQHGCAARPALVKPNASEAAELIGRPVRTLDEALAAAQALQGIAYTAISLGADGALLAHAGRAWHASAPPIRERSAIGAGDSLLAGLLWGLAQDDPVAALCWGVACGAATAARAGTEVGTREEVARLARQVTVRKL
ncbi:MAG TPA: 1-phosphofructokinase [Roseiflexaceae bacterium]|nr:1-phosphofructokinase [Roseiflexaceae bacterium]